MCAHILQHCRRRLCLCQGCLSLLATCSPAWQRVMPLKSGENRFSFHFGRLASPSVSTEKIMYPIAPSPSKEVLGWQASRLGERQLLELRVVGYEFLLTCVLLMALVMQKRAAKGLFVCSGMSMPTLQLREYEIELNKYRQISPW